MGNEKKTIKILLVDDDEFLLDMYSSKFKSSGFEVEIAKGGDEALERIKEGPVPDVILLDIIMPRMSGFELLEKINKEKISDTCKIFVLSNLGQKDEIERAKELGAVDFIVKASFTPSEVVDKIKSMV